MKSDLQKYLDFHRINGGTGKIFKFEILEYKAGFLKLKGIFPSETINPNGTVQGGQMNSMLDDVTSLLLIYESQGSIYPNSTNLHSIHHRPLFEGKISGTAKIIKLGKQIVSIEGRLYSCSGKIAATGLHTALLVKTTDIDNN